MTHERYVIADADAHPGGGWTHIFDEDGDEVEREVRFVYDRQHDSLVATGVKIDNAWEEGGRSVLLELEESLGIANPGALENPKAWGLTTADSLPGWAEIQTPEP